MTFDWHHSPTESVCVWRSLRAVVSAVSLYRYEAAVYDGVEVVWSSSGVVAETREGACEVCEAFLRIRWVDEYAKPAVAGMRSYAKGA